eukprot:TRINITY_DN1217_c2_g1_i3.p1 TRINITY_DN1217_c2_g1~~TRINITY_DN1217_c2_g1_i3.p1  ORF type:complete len:235 (-),score=75.94 TRINITY_DN1217_c2_g1_i3:391-1050(-)
MAEVEYLFKVIVVGESSTGKTSIIRRYVHDQHFSSYKSTIGLDFSMKTIQWDESSEVLLQLWDIAGQERFGNMTRAYYKGAVAAILVYDSTKRETFDKIKKWKADIDEKVHIPNNNNDKDEPTAIPCLLLANKCDLKDKFEITKEELDEYCKINNFVGWYDTSAKDDIGIDDSIQFLISKIFEEVGDSVIEEEQNEDVVNINPNAAFNKEEEETGGCSC